MFVSPRPIARRAGPVRAASRDADLKQMEDFKGGLAKSLEAAASAPPPPAPAPAAAADGRDLDEVSLAEYWDVVKAQSTGALLVMDFYTQWCGPCKLIKPTLCDWAEEWAGAVNFRKFEASKENADVGRKVRRTWRGWAGGAAAL
jgi:thioredoxin 1